MSRYAQALERDTSSLSRPGSRPARRRAAASQPSNWTEVTAPSGGARHQGTYARALERIDALTVPPLDAPTQSEGTVPSRRFAARLLPRDTAWRAELERLRGTMVMAKQLDGVQAILLCGARADDGASSVAAYLSLALAEIDKLRIALADFSQSGLGFSHVLKAALPDRRLKEVLPGSHSLYLQQTEVENLYLAAAPPEAASGMPLLQPMDVLHQLRERFSYVILNAPPVLISPDSALLAASADGVILVARPDRTRMVDLEAAKIELERAHAHVLGVVLNQCKTYLPKLLARHL